MWGLEREVEAMEVGVVWTLRLCGGNKSRGKTIEVMGRSVDAVGPNGRL